MGKHPATEVYQKSQGLNIHIFTNGESVYVRTLCKCQGSTWCTCHRDRPAVWKSYRPFISNKNFNARKKLLHDISLLQNQKVTIFHAFFKKKVMGL